MIDLSSIYKNSSMWANPYANNQGAGWRQTQGGANAYSPYSRNDSTFSKNQTQRVNPYNNESSYEYQDWFPSGTYAKWGNEGNYELPSMEQTWWRASPWGDDPNTQEVTGNVVWNDYWGFQPREQMKGIYSGYGETPVTADMFTKWGNEYGLKQNTASQDWNTYYGPGTAGWLVIHPDGSIGNSNDAQASPADVPLSGGGGAGAGAATDTGDTDMGTYSTTPAEGFGGTTYGQTEFPYPGQMTQASDIYSAFGQGMPTYAPQQWNQASDIASLYGSQGGLPVSQDPWYQTGKQTAQYDILDAINQAKEQAGLSGQRWSTPLGRTAQDIAGRTMNTFEQSYADRTAAALENARTRQMGAANQLYQYGQGYTGLEESAKDRAMQAAGQLGTLGQQMWQMPLTTASMLMQAGGQEQTAAQQQANTWLQEWLRQQPQNSPYLQSALGLGSGVGDYAQNTYGSSTGTDILGTLSSLLPLLGLL